ncbi:MAG: hypothetical protein QXZ25_05640 [Candidatus Bathyarchaeia archaeon]
MISKISLLALLAAISIITVAVIYTLQPKPTKVNFQISFAGYGGSVAATLNCTLPQVPKEVPVLRIVERSYTNAELTKIARELFNMSGELEPYGIYGFRDGSREVTLGPDGSVLFDYYVNEPRAPLRVTFQEARSIADSFLKKVMEYGLAPKSPDIQIEFSEVGASEYYGIGGMIYPTVICVSYRTLFRGIPIVRGSVHVYIGGSGEIVEFLGAWRNVEAGAPTPITVSPEESLNKIGSYWHMPTGPKKS